MIKKKPKFEALPTLNMPKTQEEPWHHKAQSTSSAIRC